MLGIVSNIEFQMFLLLFVALGGYLLASKINQSAIIGIIIAGLIIGPSVLGLVTYTDFVRSIAQLGAVILLFVIGLEFKIIEIFKIKYLMIALIGVIVPFVGGFFVAEFFGYSAATAVFVGAALTATSVAITASVLSEMGKLKSDIAKAIIGAAVIDDILGLLVLSISKQLAAGSLQIWPIILMIFKSVVFIIIGLLIGVLFLKKMILKLDQNKFVLKYPEFVFLFAMMIAFFYAMIAEIIGLSGIIGAFIAGISLEGITVRHSKDFQSGAQYLKIIFASVFFVSLGILADIHSLTLNILFFCIILTIVAILTKVIGCYIPARSEFNNKDALAIGFGMSPRGEVAMIVALIGLNTGLIPQEIYVSLIIMALVTTIITPLVLRQWFFKPE